MKQDRRLESKLDVEVVDVNDPGHRRFHPFSAAAGKRRTALKACDDFHGYFNGGALDDNTTDTQFFGFEVLYKATTPVENEPENIDLTQHNTYTTLEQNHLLDSPSSSDAGVLLGASAVMGSEAITAEAIHLKPQMSCSPGGLWDADHTDVPTLCGPSPCSRCDCQVTERILIDVGEQRILNTIYKMIDCDIPRTVAAFPTLHEVSIPKNAPESTVISEIRLYLIGERAELAEKVYKLESEVKELILYREELETQLERYDIEVPDLDFESQIV